MIQLASKFYINAAIVRRYFRIRPKHTLLISIPLYCYLHRKHSCINTPQHNTQHAANSRQPIKPISFIDSIVGYFWHTLRFFHLVLIFTPSILLLPLKMFKCTEQYWMDIFVKAIERAGVVWIKAFQYMSHRRDMIGPLMAQKFIHLRENAPTHSFEQTKKNFKQSYGKQIHQIFDQFDQLPLASGSVSQVYKAIYKGKKVAVKVRHPGVDRYIQRDINLMFFFSRIFGFFSRSFQIPVGEESLKRTLVDQTDFIHQKDNLNTFNQLFLNRKDVKFPIPFEEQTKESVLVETFVEGVPITYYEINPHPLNAVIARIGAKAFFEMLMKHNFIHADYHGGNIFVEIKENSSNFLTQILSSMKEIYYTVEQYITESMFNSEILRRLYAESRKQQAEVRKILRKYKEKVELTLIDVGMVIKLTETDRENFINFIRSVVEGNGNKCAEMIYSLSSFDGKKIIQGQFNEYLDKLKNLFSPINENNNLDKLEGVPLFTGMLDLVREYEMKLDGEFATLLTNMLVLEAIAKELNPDIQLLKCAIPYFAYAIQDKTID